MLLSIVVFEMWTWEETSFQGFQLSPLWIWMFSYFVSCSCCFWWYFVKLIVSFLWCFLNSLPG